ncbi:hypothetical protein Emag_007230 [Eimeria magna]
MPTRLSLRFLLPAAAAAAAALTVLLPSVDGASSFEEPVVSESFTAPVDEQHVSEEGSFALGDVRPPSSAVLPEDEATLPLLPDNPAATGAAEGEDVALEQLEERGVVPGEEQDMARKFVASADQMMSRLYGLAKAHADKQPRGTKTALLGAAGMIVFFLMHALTQFVSRAPISEDVLFNSDTGRTTAMGAGLIVSATLLIAGALEALIAYNAPKNAALLPAVFPSRGRKQAAIGRVLLLSTAVAITLGWVLGFPKLFMEVATTGFLAGTTLIVLGFTLLLREFQHGVSVMRQLYAPQAKDVKALNEEARIDASLLLQLADHFITKGMPEPVPLDELGHGGDEQQQHPTPDAVLEAVPHSTEELINNILGQFDPRTNGEDVDKALGGALAAAFKQIEENPKLLEQLGGLEHSILNALQKEGLDLPAAAADDDDAAAPLPANEDADQPQKEKDEN